MTTRIVFRDSSSPDHITDPTDAVTTEPGWLHISRYEPDYEPAGTYNRKLSFPSNIIAAVHWDES